MIRTVAIGFSSVVVLRGIIKKEIKLVKPGRRAGGSQKAFFSELEGDILPVIHGDPNAGS
jgi:hypothetical protein